MKKLIFLVLLAVIGFRVEAQNLTDTILTAPRKDLTVFIRAIKAAGLQYIFNSQHVTLFAPDNKAFDKLSPGKLDSLLLPANRPALITFLNGYIIPGKLTSRDIAKLIRDNNQAIFMSFAGTKLIAKVNANRNIVLDNENGGESIIKKFDIEEGTAEIFTIDSVIIPQK